MKQLFITLMKRLTNIATILDLGFLLYAIAFGFIEDFKSKDVIAMLTQVSEFKKDNKTNVTQ